MVPNNSALVCFQVYRKLNESLDMNTNSAVGGTNSQQMALLSKAKTSISQALDRLESENNEVLFDYTIVLFQDCLFNPFPNKPWVLHVCSTKLLVKSNFSFSHSVFYSLGELSAIFIRPSKTGRIMGSPMAGGRAGGRRPLLCLENISKTILATVMKFHGWIDLIKGECSVQES